MKNLVKSINQLSLPQALSIAAVITIVAVAFIATNNIGLVVLG